MSTYRCPVHGIPDCSALLNGCSIPVHVAAREVAAEQRGRVAALREAAKEWQWGGWADDLPPGHSRPQLILGMAQRASSWLRAEADRIERGESS